jgi:predicted flap endonuclease-1-like 5' DNA nuclease
MHLRRPDGKNPLELQLASDGLKHINGIGWGLKRKLNAAGIFHGVQLAVPNSNELKQIASRTKKAYLASWAMRYVA